MTEKNKQQMSMQAQQVVGNPAYIAAVAAVRGFYTESMINTKPDEAAQREHLHRCIHALSDVQTALTAFIESGKIEKQMAVKKEKAKK
jgi:hypothetical protein